VTGGVSRGGSGETAGDVPGGVPHGGDRWAAARRWGRDPDNFLDFSSNLNPFGPPRGTLGRLRALAPLATRYPDPRAAAARAAVSRYLDVPEASVVLGNGANELLYLLARVLPAGRALVPVPTYGQYRRALELAGVAVQAVPMDPGAGFALPMAELRARLETPGNGERGAAGEGGAPGPPPTLVVLCRPNNPTGVLYPAGDVAELARLAAGTGGALLLDEAFVDFAGPRARTSLAPLAAARPGLVVVWSLTKWFTVPGLRLGAAVAVPEVAAALESLRDPWNTNSLAQAVAGHLCGARGYARTRRLVARERERFSGRLAEIGGLEAWPSTACFFLVRVTRPGWSAAALADALGRRGFLVREATGFENLAPSFLRLAVRRPAENDRLVAAVAEALAGPAPQTSRG